MRPVGVIIAALAFAMSAWDGQAWGGGFDRAIESALPRVVKLYGLGVGLEAGYGTGVVISQDGLVLTVFSLLIDARRVRAVAPDGKTYEAQVLYRDYPRQLALLRLKSPAQDTPVGPFPFFDLACGQGGSGQGQPVDSLKPGDWVLAAGNAFKVADGAEPVSITHGVFSTRTRLDARRRVKDFPYAGEVLVIDAITSNPGAPGGALVDLDGLLVGMIGRQVTSNLTHTHFNYAIPGNVLCEFLHDARSDPAPDALRAAGFSPRGPTKRKEPDELFETGIRLSKAGYRTVLPFVERVQRDSPAAQAGVRKDDLILAVNGKNVADVDQYESRIRACEPGEPLTLVIRRRRRILTVQLTNSEASKRQNVETSKQEKVP